MCPHCRQNAPIVYRGVNAFCTACNGPRMPLASQSVNMAGQPSKVGGLVARIFGWLVLAGGTLVAGLFAFVLIAINAVTAGYVVGGVLEAVTLAIAIALLKGGKKLKEEGADYEKATRAKAIFALANTRGGVLTPADVGHAINVSPQEGDDILTDLAKAYPDHVTIDVDDNGTILYRFSAAQWAAISRGYLDPRLRADARARAGTMAPNQVRVAQPMQAPPPVRVDASAAGREIGEPLEDDLGDAGDARRQRAR